MTTLSVGHQLWTEALLCFFCAVASSSWSCITEQRLKEQFMRTCMVINDPNCKFINDPKIWSWPLVFPINGKQGWWQKVLRKMHNTIYREVDKDREVDQLRGWGSLLGGKEKLSYSSFQARQSSMHKLRCLRPGLWAWAWALPLPSLHQMLTEHSAPPHVNVTLLKRLITYTNSSHW